LGVLIQKVEKQKEDISVVIYIYINPKYLMMI